MAKYKAVNVLTSQIFMKVVVIHSVQDTVSIIIFIMDVQNSIIIIILIIDMIPTMKMKSKQKSYNELPTAIFLIPVAMKHETHCIQKV